MQTSGVLEVTDCAPSLPSVLPNCAVNPPPAGQIGFEGMLVIVGPVGVTWPIVKVWVPPEAAAKSVVCAVSAVNVQLPAVT